MSWTLVWSIPAERDLLWMPWRVAARIDAEVMRFAATGRGAERVSATDPRRVRVRVANAEARIYLDPVQRIVFVARVFRREY
jgi:hypothetical protein